MKALASMGRAEIEDIIEEQGKVEVTCEFCKDTVIFSEDELLNAKVGPVRSVSSVGHLIP